MAEDSENELNSLNERKRILQDINDIQEESSKNIASALNFGKNYNKILQQQKSLRKDINIYQDALNSGEMDGKKLSADTLNLLAKKKQEYEKIVKNSESVLKNVSKTQIAFKTLNNEIAHFGNSLNIYDFLLEADKSIKKLNTDLGLSGALAETFKNNIQGAASQAALLGLSISDLTAIQSEYVDTTDKLVSLSSAALIQIGEIGTSTGLGNEFAASMAGNFNMIGLSAKATNEFVEGTLKSSSDMGVNGVKTVKLMKDNFDKINKYRFQGGVESFKNMVQASQQTKQNIESVFSASENFRSLDQAIENSAMLSTLGGNMAKQDVFQLSFLARNDPEKFAEKLHSMTEGIYSFNKSTGEFKASAVDLDRLREMAKITGQDFEKLSIEARKAAETKFISSKTMGLSKNDQKLISQMAEMNESTKKFQVTIDGKSLDIDQLTTPQIALLKQEQASLAERTKSNQDFEKTFQSSVMELKTALLPMLDTINWLLKQVNSIGDSWGANLTKLALLGGGIGALKLVSANLGTILTKMVSLPASGIGKMLGGGIGKAGGGIASTVLGNAGAAGQGTETLAKGLTSIPSSSQLLSKAAGIASIGVAALGIGAGIYLAAKGVSSLADSFAKLKPNQINGVLKAMGIMGVTMLALGVAGSFAGPGLIGVGAGIALIGGGIFLAATGMAKLVESFGGIKDPTLGTNLMNMGLGIGSIAASTALLSNPLSLLGLGALTGFLTLMNNTVDFSAMSSAFQNASAFMSAPSSNLDKLKETIALLNNVDTSVLSGMKEMLAQFGSKPLQVEFKDKTVALNIDITNNIDGDALGKKMQIGRRAMLDIVNARRGT